jgi:hypothetical protein
LEKKYIYNKNNKIINYQNIILINEDVSDLN